MSRQKSAYRIRPFVLLKITDLPFTYRFIVSRSASNKQPWRIIKGKGQDAFHFYLKRSPGYENITKDIKLQNVDMGIAMCHFELSAKELGLKGDRSVNDPQITKDDMEYRKLDSP